MASAIPYRKNKITMTMKRLMLTLISICCLQLHLVSAQSAEIQQLLLNVEKLAQFKQILSDMKKGYEVVFKGYNSIKNISEGNFDLHKTFLDGLLKVNPEVAKYKRVADIVRYQAALLSEYKSAYKRFASSGRFNAKEMVYMQGVYRNLLDRSLEDLDELVMTLSASKLRMSDAERINAIDRLYRDMESKLVFLRGFNKRTTALDNQRKQQQKEQDLLKKMYGQ